MSTLLSLVSGGWSGLLAVGAVVAAFVAAWFGGRQVGKSRQRATSDIAAAQKSAQQISAVAKQQAAISQEAKRVQADNAAVTDGDARRRMQQSPFHADDK